MKKKKKEKIKEILLSLLVIKTNYINDCLKYFPQGIDCKECFIFYKLY